MSQDPIGRLHEVRAELLETAGRVERHRAGSLHAAAELVRQAIAVLAPGADAAGDPGPSRDGPTGVTRGGDEIPGVVEYGLAGDDGTLGDRRRRPGPQRRGNGEVLGS